MPGGVVVKRMSEQGWWDCVCNQERGVNRRRPDVAEHPSRNKVLAVSCGLVRFSSVHTRTLRFVDTGRTVAEDVS